MAWVKTVFKDKDSQNKIQANVLEWWQQTVRHISKKAWANVLKGRLETPLPEELPLVPPTLEVKSEKLA